MTSRRRTRSDFWKAMVFPSTAFKQSRSILCKIKIKKISRAQQQCSLRNLKRISVSAPFTQRFNQHRGHSNGFDPTALIHRTWDWDQTPRVLAFRFYQGFRPSTRSSFSSFAIRQPPKHTQRGTSNQVRRDTAIFEFECPF